MNLLLRDLVDEVSEIPRVSEVGGRPPIPLSDALLCAILKVYSCVSSRRVHGVYVNAADLGLLEKVPSFIVASRILNKEYATPVLHHLLGLSALPLAGLEEGGTVAPDSTGIQTTSFGAWRETKHGERRLRRWMKVHAMVGTKTHVILRAIVDDTNSADAPRFTPLLRETMDIGFHPSSVVADKGYLSKANYELADSLGLAAFIPFKSNSRNRVQGERSPRAWRKAFYMFQANREEFDRSYHKRANVESVFSALKRKFGENIRSKNPVAQVNEVLCKLIAYNLTVVVHEMFENGIAPVFTGELRRSHMSGGMGSFV